VKRISPKENRFSFDNVFLEQYPVWEIVNASGASQTTLHRYIQKKYKTMGFIFIIIKLAWIFED
jgi:hypothetical protein